MNIISSPPAVCMGPTILSAPVHMASRHHPLSCHMPACLLSAICKCQYVQISRILYARQVSQPYLIYFMLMLIHEKMGERNHMSIKMSLTLLPISLWAPGMVMMINLALCLDLPLHSHPMQPRPSCSLDVTRYSSGGPRRFL